MFARSSHFNLKNHIKSEGPFHENSQCSFCPTVFKTWEDHKEHLDRNHNGTFRYTCGHCGLNHFSTYDEFVHHKTMCLLSKATQELQYYPDGKHISCTICNEKVCSSRFEVRNHLKEHHPTLAIHCDQCTQVFFYELALTRHKKSAHNKIFGCDECDNRYSTGAQLREHKKSHLLQGQDNYVCPECGKGFTKQPNLTIHIRYVHEGHRNPSDYSEKEVTCEKCGEVLRQHRMKYHRKKCHSRELHSCPDCGLTFQHPQNLRSHLQTHVTLTCDICGEQVSKKNMRYHLIQKHTADSKKPNVCNICHKGFASKIRLGEHMNVHTGARPFNCLFCSKTFACQSNSYKHMKESHAEQYKTYKLQRGPSQRDKWLQSNLPS